MFRGIIPRASRDAAPGGILLYTYVVVNAGIITIIIIILINFLQSYTFFLFYVLLFCNLTEHNTCYQLGFNYYLNFLELICFALQVFIVFCFNKIFFFIIISLGVEPWNSLVLVVCSAQKKIDVSTTATVKLI